MGKIKYGSKEFDSQLEVDYYRYLENQDNILRIVYHPKAIPNLVGKRSYTPDFLVMYVDHWEVVETKGYNPYSKMIDDQIHTIMQSKDEAWLRSYLMFNGFYVDNTTSVRYVKLKFLKAYGFVEWDFKNPNTIANKRKEKINIQKDEIKELKEFKKGMIRYLKYMYSTRSLTKPQREWLKNFTQNEIPKILREECDIIV